MFNIIERNNITVDTVTLSDLECGDLFILPHYVNQGNFDPKNVQLITYFTGDINDPDVIITRPFETGDIHIELQDLPTLSGDTLVYEVVAEVSNIKIV